MPPAQASLYEIWNLQEEDRVKWDYKYTHISSCNLSFVNLVCFAFDVLTYLKTCQPLMYSGIMTDMLHMSHDTTRAHILKFDRMKRAKWKLESYLHIVDNPVDKELRCSSDNQVLLLTGYKVAVDRKLHCSGSVSLSVDGIHPE